MTQHKTLADLETYLLSTEGMERGQDPVQRAITIMETLAGALWRKGVVRRLTPAGVTAKEVGQGE